MLLSPGVLCYWSGWSPFHHRFWLRHFEIQPKRTVGHRKEELWSETRCHHQEPESQRSHLPEDGLLRSLWPRHFHLGETQATDSLTAAEVKRLTPFLPNFDPPTFFSYFFIHPFFPSHSRGSWLAVLQHLSVVGSRWEVGRWNTIT